MGHDAGDRGLNIVSFYAPRPEHPFFQDYEPFLDVLRNSCEWFGHRHICITDDPAIGDAFCVDLPRPLMKAILAGQLAYLRSDLASEDTVLLGADCVLANDPAKLFVDDPWFELAVTHGPFVDCWMNTGAMFVRGGSVHTVAMWEAALARCGDDWGDDQLSLASELPWFQKAGGRLQLLQVDPYNLAPESVEDDCRRAMVLHFRGPRKAWLLDYCARWVFPKRAVSLDGILVRPGGCAPPVMVGFNG